MLAVMNTNRQTFRHNGATPAARLGCIERIHGNDLDTSFFRFVFKVLPEQSKPGVVGSAGKMSVTVHKAEGKVFNCDQVKLLDDGIGSFVKEVAALIGDQLVKCSDLGISLTLAGTAPDLTGSMTLKAAKFGKIGLQRAGVVNQFTGGKGGEGFQPHVNSDHLFCRDARLDRIGQLDHQTSIPAQIGLLDDHMLDLSLDGNRSVIAHPHLADVLDVETHPSIAILAQLATVTVGKFDTFEAALALEPGKAGGVSGLDSAEERGKGFIETAKQLLEAGGVDPTKRIGVLPAQISKMRPLSRIIDPFARFLIGGNSLLQSSVIDQAGLPQKEVQSLSLLGRRAQEILESADHRTIVLVIVNKIKSYRKERSNRASSAA